MFKKLFKKSNDFAVLSPMNGRIVPIEDVPDPVFSEKMMGDGVAIWPKDGRVVAPVTGVVLHVPDSKHAIGLKTEDGTEVLIHVGLETVALAGKGFTVHASVGDQVEVGELLLECDLAYIEEHASSMITPVVITEKANEKDEFVMSEHAEAKGGETTIMTRA
ncbi:PTS glucose transporter subunit IIA [Geomicrobium sp. JSM 1781026]|uniref:PTS sugar transporter subunit IIA n=1 Tax=Geomicrobium sp. JSM 1781026 TaxID=3344580 RepID=UPI0035C0BAD0